MLSTLSAVVAPWGYGPWVGFPFFFFLFPLVWILVIVLLFVFLGRRMRRRWGVDGPWAQGRSGESVLAERFANGDIDEVEYRARLEVLRANREQPR